MDQSKEEIPFISPHIQDLAIWAITFHPILLFLPGCSKIPIQASLTMAKLFICVSPAQTHSSCQVAPIPAQFASSLSLSAYNSPIYPLSPLHLQSRQISPTSFLWPKKKSQFGQIDPTSLQHSPLANPSYFFVLFSHFSPHLLIFLSFRFALMLSIPSRSEQHPAACSLPSLCPPTFGHHVCQ